MKTTGLTGLIAAPFTPMRADGALNLDVIERQAEGLLRDGVAGAFVCGTTGEGLSLSTAERQQVTERWVQAAAGKLKIIVHVGHNSLGESRLLAAHAAAVGADAFATVGPTFFKPSTVEELAEFCARTAEAAPDLPFYFYHIPVLSGIRVPMPEFMALAARQVPNFAGLKFTDEDLMSYAQCRAMDNDRFDVLFGRDEILLAALAMGAKGAVGSTYNYMAPIFQRLIAAFHKGDLQAARREQLTAIRIIDVMARHGGLRAGKAMMGLIGTDCGPVRLPLRKLSPAENTALARELDAVGFPTAIHRRS